MKQCVTWRTRDRVICPKRIARPIVHIASAQIERRLRESVIEMPNY